ncbi:hypothetical protein COCCADRAFT_38546 [Bipolaris zeicola 26-R-13]|uniref:Uncharacterized protein n=1 Tax=Cochliobolus carbonum (strain 26-R-13) TaxID=930089 RepID=W6Y057_COCC2|nr:uncharacterized protein COCCADRAFT_38546 [Bipolaris zeicola 26-R-13]EUC31353.1 hypothetical protein COCCADRAFT_38546 [Bipolaris zeicola 26-R-13]
MTEITNSAAMIGDCTHTVSSSLVVKLPSSQNACPVCVITSQMAAVRAAQNHFLTRGGVFMSSSGDVKKHVIATRYWKKTKIALANTIIKFESLLNKPGLPVEDMARLSEALEIWDDQKIFLGRVPGLRYVRGPDTPVPTEEDRERARVFMNWPALRTLIAPKPSNPIPYRKHVRISPFATISSEHLSTANPSPFKSLSRTCATAPHSIHTTAEHKRHKYAYFRRHPTYAPGAWASVEGSRKANTSFYHAKPWAVEMYVGRELKREERERKAAVQLGRDGREWMVALGEVQKMDVQGVRLERLVVWLSGFGDG